MNLNKINEITAKACGVEIRTDTYLYDDACIYFYIGKQEYNFEWTIEDVRCREIFRNWWLAQDDNAVLFESNLVTYFTDYNYGQGNAVCRENEMACITAIAESIGESDEQKF